MSSFIPNIPQPGDELADSQGQLLGNNQQLDTSFGINHYTFSNQTSDNGKHREIDLPDQSGDVTVISGDAKIYATSRTGNLPVFEYSRYYDETLTVPGVPTPVTSLQSPASPQLLVTGSPITVFDFNGLDRAMAIFTGFADFVGGAAGIVYYVWYDGSILSITPLATATNLSLRVSGTEIRVSNNGATPLNVYWTLNFMRVT